MFTRIKSALQVRAKPVADTLVDNRVAPLIVDFGILFASLVMGLVLLSAVNVRFLYILLPVFLVVRLYADELSELTLQAYSSQGSDIHGPLARPAHVVIGILSDASLYLPLILLTPSRSYLVFAVVALIAITELLTLKGKPGAAGDRQQGPLDSFGRALVFSALGLSLAFVKLSGQGLVIIWVVLALLQAWTVLRRLSPTEKPRPVPTVQAAQPPKGKARS